MIVALRLVMNGLYKVAIKLPKEGAGVKQEKFKFRIKTSCNNAIILLVRDELEISDKLRMKIKNSRVVLDIGNGKG